MGGGRVAVSAICFMTHCLLSGGQWLPHDVHLSDVSGLFVAVAAWSVISFCGGAQRGPLGAKGCTGGSQEH